MVKVKVISPFNFQQVARLPGQILSVSEKAAKRFERLGVVSIVEGSEEVQTSTEGYDEVARSIAQKFGFESQEGEDSLTYLQRFADEYFAPDLSESQDEAPEADSPEAKWQEFLFANFPKDAAEHLIAAGYYTNSDADLATDEQLDAIPGWGEALIARLREKIIEFQAGY